MPTSSGSNTDIKPSNILIKDRQPYLADFGFAKDFSEQGSSISQSIFVEGTPVYFALENQPRGNHGRPADIFALGCVFSEMLTVGSKMSLEEYRHWRRVPESVYGSFAFRENLPKVREWLDRIEKGHLNDLIVHQTLQMLHQDPDRRPTAQEGINKLYRQRALFCIE
jgi:serine/threonine protein kinase